jgi:hypothetical protein
MKEANCVPRNKLQVLYCGAVRYLQQLYQPAAKKQVHQQVRQKYVFFNFIPVILSGSWSSQKYLFFWYLLESIFQNQNFFFPSKIDSFSTRIHFGLLVPFFCLYFILIVLRCQCIFICIRIQIPNPDQLFHFDSDQDWAS